MKHSLVVELDTLTIAYGRQTVMEGAQLELERGQVHALLGRNGTGKSSLIRCLLGQQLPKSGRALLFGQSVLPYRAGLMARVGLTPEEPNAPSHWSAAKLARYCKPLYPVWKGTAYFDRLARWQIDAERPFGQLSRGQKSLVQLALALANEPDLLVLDDPTLGLDAVARRIVIDEIIGQLAERETTVLLASHDFDLVERLATHVSLVHGGRLQLSENLEELRSRFRLLVFQPQEDEDLESLLRPLQPLAVRSIGRTVEVLTGSYDLEKCCRLTDDFQSSVPTLEQVFVAMTASGPVQPS